MASGQDQRIDDAQMSVPGPGVECPTTERRDNGITSGLGCSRAAASPTRTIRDNDKDSLAGAFHDDSVVAA
jgi:hypothetical protein